jgi:hypothetical protein
MKKKNKTLEQLKLFYVLVFALGALIIVPTHIFPQPYFMYARFPHYLEQMKPFLGTSWPMTFEIYHYVLYILGLILSFNALGILIYPKLKKIVLITSFIAVFLFLLITIFFFFKFTTVKFSTAIIFGLYSTVLSLLSLLTHQKVSK